MSDGPERLRGLPANFWRESFGIYVSRTPEETIAAFTVVLAVVGALGTLVGLLSLLVIKGQLDEMQSSSAQTDKIIAVDTDLAQAAKDQAAAQRDNVELSQRAWIGPFDAKVAPLALDQPVKVTVEYRNSGRQPAQMLQFVFQRRFSEQDYINIKTGFKFVLDAQTTCKNSDIYDLSQTVFPTEQSTFYNSFSDSGAQGLPNTFKADQALIDGKQVDVVVGCFIYRTFGKVRHTAFSYFYKAGVTTDPAHLNIYPYTGFAD